MISCKRDVLERQSLSEVKMGRGSPICERVRKKIVEYFKTTFLKVKLQRLCKSHHLQCITSSKDSEKLEKSLCVRDKAEDVCWMPRGLRALRLQCITHQHDSVIDITKWAQEYFQKPLSVNTIRCAICRCQLKLYHTKRKPYVNMVQKRPWPRSPGQLACFGRHYECWKVYKGFRATYALLQITCISAG